MQLLHQPRDIYTFLSPSRIINPEDLTMGYCNFSSKCIVHFVSTSKAQENRYIDPDMFIGEGAELRCLIRCLRSVRQV